jgi:hypothetical protein
MSLAFLSVLCEVFKEISTTKISVSIFIFEGCILLRLLLQPFWGPSITTAFFECFLLLFHTHYMFRPLRAIFRWNILVPPETCRGYVIVIRNIRKIQLRLTDPKKIVIQKHITTGEYTEAYSYRGMYRNILLQEYVQKHIPAVIYREAYYGRSIYRRNTAIHNFRDCCWPHYRRCSSAMQW